MNDPKEETVAWLRDAHAMEANLADMLEGQVEHLADYPEFQEGVSQHAEESRRHASLVESALESLGEDTSALKDGVAKLAGKLSPLGISMTSDAPVKIVLANYAAEHFEIACYRSIEAAAEATGMEEIARMCRVILSDEERMARTLEPLIPAITMGHLGIGSVTV
jgi:ferritin-like metal-binding protein YciE